MVPIMGILQKRGMPMVESVQFPNQNGLGQMSIAYSKSRKWRHLTNDGKMTVCGKKVTGIEILPLLINCHECRRINNNEKMEATS